MKKEVFHVYKDTEKHYPTNLDLFLSTSIKKSWGNYDMFSSLKLLALFFS